MPAGHFVQLGQEAHPLIQAAVSSRTGFRSAGVVMVHHASTSGTRIILPRPNPLTPIASMTAVTRALFASQGYPFATIALLMASRRIGTTRKFGASGLGSLAMNSNTSAFSFGVSAFALPFPHIAPSIGYGTSSR